MTSLLSGLQMAHTIRQGHVSAAELVQTTIDKIERENPQLNALVHQRYSAALQEAHQLKDTGQPFLGVPLLLKNCGQHLQGLPSTAGAKLCQNVIPDHTDNFVQALQRAGFIILGAANCPEFAFKNVTDPDMYGPTVNPWNPKYSPGGSSGGAAASVAAGWVPLAAASDGGGSIRIPAAWTGLIGLKPTRGRVPVGPHDWRSWQGAATHFAITRTLTDAAALLDALQTWQLEAPFNFPPSASSFLTSLKQPLDQTITIGYSVTSPMGTPVSSQARYVVEEAVTMLANQGFEVAEIKWPFEGHRLINSYYRMNEAETAAMMSELAIYRPQVLKPTDMEPLTWGLYQAGQHLAASQLCQDLAYWDQVTADMMALHRRYKVILTPTTATTAPTVATANPSATEQEALLNSAELSPLAQQQLIYDQWLPALTRTPFTQVANLTGQPALSVPLKVTNQQLPLGLQLLGAKGDEASLFQLARYFEEQLGFNQPFKEV